MIIRLFDGVYVRAERVNEIRVMGSEFEAAVYVWLDEDSPSSETSTDKARVCWFDTKEEAVSAAHDLRTRVNDALKGWS